VAAPDPRTLEALGLAEIPREHPLSYPGAWPEESGLLDGDRLLPLSRLVYEDRVPVLAVGSNACPAQLRHKMAQSGVSGTIPLVKARVGGIGVGVSAHVSLMGYVSASPFHDGSGAPRGSSCSPESVHEVGLARSCDGPLTSLRGPGPIGLT